MALAAAVPQEPVVAVLAQQPVLALVLALAPPRAPALQALAQLLVVLLVVRLALPARAPREGEPVVLVREPAVPAERRLSRQSPSAAMARSTT